MARVRLGWKDIENFEIRVIRIFKDYKAEKLDFRDSFYDYRVGKYRFKIDTSCCLFYVWYIGDDEGKEQHFSCNNEENVINNVRSFMKKILM